MVTFLTISRHAPTECPAHNEKNAKVIAEWMSTHEALEAKHGIKMVGFWNVHPEHLTIQAYEAPTLEAFQAYSMEPVMMKVLNFETVEAKIAMTLEETNQLVQMMQQK